MIVPNTTISSAITVDGYYGGNITGNVGSGTICADKIILSGIEIAAEPVRPRHKRQHHLQNVTPSYSFTNTLSIHDEHDNLLSQYTCEHVNVQSLQIETIPSSNQPSHIDVKVVGANGNRSAFISADSMLEIVEDLYDHINRKQIINIQPSMVDSIMQKVDYHRIEIADINQIIQKQNNNMEVLRAMLIKQQAENKELHKKIQELESDIASL